MLQIRWVQLLSGEMQLQQRGRVPRVDGNGAFCDFSEWSDWSAVEIVHDPSQVVPVVDVFESRKG